MSNPMTDQPETRTRLAVRLVIDVYDLPLGETEWRFVTTADGKTVAVTTPVAVVPAKAADA